MSLFRTGYLNSNNTPTRLEYPHRYLLRPSHDFFCLRHSGPGAAAVGWRSTSLLAEVVGSRLPVAGILVVGIEGSSLLRLLVVVGCSNLGHGGLERGWVEAGGRDRRLGGRGVGRREVGIPARVRSLHGFERVLEMGNIRF